MIRILIKPLMPYLERVLLCCIVGTIGVHLQGCGGPLLKPWHTERLAAEFTTKKKSEIQSFDDYRQLEDTLFAQLEEKVYNQTGAGPGYELVRYSSGSSADPQHRRPNWNRSFELPTDEPAGGECCCTACRIHPTACVPLGKPSTRASTGFSVHGCQGMERHRRDSGASPGRTWPPSWA